jgi:hypothetical protein
VPPVVFLCVLTVERDHDEAIGDISPGLTCKLAVSQCSTNINVRSLCPTSCITTNPADYTKDQDTFITTKYSQPGGCSQQMNLCWKPSLVVWCPITCGTYISLPTCKCKADWSNLSTALLCTAGPSAGNGCVDCTGWGYTWCVRSFSLILGMGRCLAT